MSHHVSHHRSSSAIIVLGDPIRLVSPTPTSSCGAFRPGERRSGDSRALLSPSLRSRRSSCSSRRAREAFDYSLDVDNVEVRGAARVDDACRVENDGAFSAYAQSGAVLWPGHVAAHSHRQGHRALSRAGQRPRRRRARAIPSSEFAGRHLLRAREARQSKRHR